MFKFDMRYFTLRKELKRMQARCWKALTIVLYFYNYILLLNNLQANMCVILIAYHRHETNFLLFKTERDETLQ